MSHTFTKNKNLGTVTEILPYCKLLWMQQTSYLWPCIKTSNLPLMITFSYLDYPGLCIRHPWYGPSPTWIILTCILITCLGEHMSPSIRLFATTNKLPSLFCPNYIRIQCLHKTGYVSFCLLQCYTQINGTEKYTLVALPLPLINFFCMTFH